MLAKLSVVKRLALGLGLFLVESFLQTELLASLPQKVHAQKAAVYRAELHAELQNAVAGSEARVSQKDDWVRFALYLTAFEQARDHTAKKILKKKVLKQVLRANLVALNHFYIGDYHLETQPLEWNRTTMRYRTKLSVFARFGAQGEVEEKLGELTLSGVLTGKAPLFVLAGLSKVLLRDKFNLPVMEIIAGSPELTERQKLAIKQGDSATLLPSVE